jgi:hypothetical protein
MEVGLSPKPVFLETFISLLPPCQDEASDFLCVLIYPHIFCKKSTRFAIITTATITTILVNKRADFLEERREQG